MFLFGDAAVTLSGSEVLLMRAASNLLCTGG